MGFAVEKKVGAGLASVLPRDERPWWRKRQLLKLNFTLGSAMLFASTCGYDNSLMNGLQTLDQWQEFMQHPQGTYLGGINAIQAAGSCLSLPMMSYVAIRFGRKASLYIGCAFLSLGTALQAAAQNPAMFIASRFFVGMATGFFLATPVLVAECAYPTHRGRMTAGYNTLYYVGSLLSAWATYGTRNYIGSWAWRIPVLLQVCIPAVCIWGVILAPESPRWQVSKGNVAQARQMLVKYHAEGDECSSLVKFEMEEIEQALKIESEDAVGTSYLDMVKTKGNRHRTLISVSIGVFSQWCGNGVVSYYLAIVLATVGVTSVTQQTLINGFLQLWNLILAVTAAALVDRLGRRFLFLTSSVGMLFCYIVITGLSGYFAEHGSSAVGIAVIPMLFIYFAFYDVAFTPLLIAYPTEIWPYKFRSKGMVVSQISTSAALFFNLFVNPIGLANLAWKYYLVYIVILVVICISIYFFYIETRGHTLEEIAMLFDGDKAAVAPTRPSTDEEAQDENSAIIRRRH